MNRKLIVAIAGIAIGSCNFLSAQTPQERAAADRIVNAFRANVDPVSEAASVNQALPPIIQQNDLNRAGAITKQWAQEGAQQSGPVVESFRSHEPPSGTLKSHQYRPQEYDWAPQSVAQPMSPQQHHSPIQGRPNYTFETYGTYDNPTFQPIPRQVLKPGIQKSDVLRNELRSKETVRFAPRPAPQSFSMQPEGKYIQGSEIDYRSPGVRQKSSLSQKDKLKNESTSSRILRLKSQPISAHESSHKVVEKNEHPKTIVQESIVPEPLVPEKSHALPVVDDKANGWVKPEVADLEPTESASPSQPLESQPLEAHPLKLPVAEQANEFEPKLEWASPEAIAGNKVEIQETDSDNSFPLPPNQTPSSVQLSQDDPFGETEFTAPGFAAPESPATMQPAEVPPPIEQNVVTDVLPAAANPTEIDNSFRAPLPHNNFIDQVVQPEWMKQQEPTVQVPMVQSSIEPASQPNSEVSQFINQGASSQRATKSKFGAWWWFVLPVVPLLLLGWAVWRNRKEQREKLAFEREQRRVAGNFLGTTGAGIVKPSEKPIKIREHKSATKDLSIKTQRASTENGRQLGTPISGFASSKTSANETVKQESGSRTTKVYKLTGQSEGSGPDDLTKISGIGQATQKFLNKQGINCFEQIAKMDGQQLKEIFAGSSRFQFLNPATWPAQAKEILQASLSCQEAEVLEDIKSISKSNSPTTQMPELKFGTILKDQKFTNPSK